MSVAISWANKMQLAKCDIMVGFPISSHIIIIIYRIAQLFGGVKLWRIDRFRVLVGENVGEFTIANIATLVNLEFGGVKYWRMVFGSPNNCAIRYIAIN